MAAFAPRPTFRGADPNERVRLALDMPYSLGQNLWEQGQQGVLDSFGLGTAVRDMSIPQGNVPRSPVVGAAPILGPIYVGAKSLVELFRPDEPSLSKEQYQASPSFREAIPWEPGMTEQRAAALAGFWDMKTVRNHFGQKRPISSFFGQLAGQALDPINYIPMVGPAMQAAAVARAGSIVGRALMGASDAVLNTAVFGALTRDTRAKFGDDVSWQAMAVEIGMSALIGGAFGGGVGFLSRGRDIRERQAVNQARQRVDTIKTQTEALVSLNEAVSTLAIDGEVRLSPNGIAPVEATLAVANAPTPAARLADETTGITGTKAGEVVITPQGTRVAVRPEVVELSTLSKATGSLQVRDRTTASSTAQIEDIAIGLDPARLMPNVDASQGAPLVGPDGVVDSGNGRVAAIRRAYEAYPEKAAAYRAALDEAGYSTEGFQNPVLVSRRVTDLSPDARARFNAEANASTTAKMSAVELAQMDRDAIMSGSVLDALTDGPVTSADNRAFVDRFLNQLPQNERGALVDSSGTKLSADGERRVENALVSAAYGDVDAGVIRRFAEATDDNTRAIVGAMADVAGKWAQMRQAMQRGEIGPEFDPTTELTEALSSIGRWRDQAAREKRAVSTVIREGMGQIDMFTGDMSIEAKFLIRAMFNNDHFAVAVGRDRLSARLGNVIDEAFNLGRPSLFGDDLAVTKGEMLRNALADDVETDLFAAPDVAERPVEGTGRPAGEEAGGGNRPDVAQARPPIGGVRGVVTTMRQRFVEAGRPADEAEANATLIAEFYRTTAARTGRSVDDLEAQFGLPEIRQGGMIPEGAMMQPGSPAFKRWFGDSKVVDESGEPLIVYHGTNQPIEKFDIKRGGAATGENAGATKAFFFTSSKPEADQYARHAGRRVVSNVEAFEAKRDTLKAEVDRLERAAKKTGDWDAYERAAQEWEDLEIRATQEDETVGANIVEAYLSLKNPMVVDLKGGRYTDATDLDVLIDKAKAAGNDGIIVRNVEDSPEMGIVSDQFVAFEPTQIKSTANRGTFDPADPRILYQDMFDTESGAEGLPQTLIPGVKPVTEGERLSVESDKPLKGGNKPPPKGGLFDVEGREDAAAQMTLFQPAYHGTPHVFDKFSSDKIGTGEGNQSFGQGLYFAGRKEVAQSYRDKLAGAPIDAADGVINYFVRYAARMTEGNLSTRIAERMEAAGVKMTPEEVALARRAVEGGKPGAAGSIDWSEDAVKALSRLDDLLQKKSRGRLFKVDIPGDEELLAWEQPLGEQSQKVRDAVGPLIPPIEFGRGNTGAAPDGLMIYLNKGLDDAKKPIWRVEALGLKDPMIANNLPSLDAAKAAAQKWSNDRLTGDQAYTAIAGKYRDYSGFPKDIRGSRRANETMASRDLREAGIPGHRYLDGHSRDKAEGQTYNYVIYDDSRVNVIDYEQRARGSIQFGDDKSIITLFETADSSTALHETGHHFLHMFKSMAERADAPADMRADWDQVKGWWDANADAVAKDSPSDVTAADVRSVLTQGTTGDRVKDLAINVGLQEQWARGFEAYAREGIAPTEGLKGIFEQFKRWLSSIYAKAQDLNVNLSPEIRDVFDRLLGRPQAAAEAPTLDLRTAAPDVAPEALAPASARVGKPEAMRELAEAHGVKEDGTFIEQGDIDQIREEGNLTPEDEAALKAADDEFDMAEAWGRALEAAMTCVVPG